MGDVRALVDAFLGSPAGQATVAVAVLALVDFVLGTLAALRDGTFRWDAIAAWVRKHLAGRVGPIAVVLAVGHAAGGISFDDGVSGVLSPGAIVTGIGLAAAASYLAETIASIRDSLTADPTRAVPQD